MALHVFVFVFLLVVCFLLSLALLWRLGWFPVRPSSSKGAAKRSRLHRLLKPRSPDDCPACRLASTALVGGGPAPLPVRPWSEVKSRRGAPKCIPTEGFACPNRQCSYFGNTDARVHAAFWGWQAWPCRADSDLSVSGLSHHLQCSTRYALVPVENPVLSRRHGAGCTGRRVGPIGGRTRLRLPTSDHHHLVVSRGLARSDLARTRFQSSPASLSSVG
jgi:hypothetical protein